MTNIFIAFVTSVAAVANLMPVAFPALPTEVASKPSIEVTESAKAVVETAKPVETKTAIPKGRVVTVTAYTSEVGQTDSTPCTSADGSNICVKYAEGEKICATNDHKMHAKLYIQGYGECIVRDRMNKRYTGTGRVDIYLGKDTPAAFKWGARRVEVARL
jgi:3D (Asp-Asp-Asp) domain-containing protein